MGKECLQRKEGEEKSREKYGKRRVGLRGLETGVGGYGPPALLHVSPTKFLPVPPYYNLGYFFALDFCISAHPFSNHPTEKPKIKYDCPVLDSYQIFVPWSFLCGPVKVPICYFDYNFSQMHGDVHRGFTHRWVFTICDFPHRRQQIDRQPFFLGNLLTTAEIASSGICLVNKGRTAPKVFEASCYFQ